MPGAARGSQRYSQFMNEHTEGGRDGARLSNPARSEQQRKTKSLDAPTVVLEPRWWKVGGPLSSLSVYGISTLDNAW